MKKPDLLTVDFFSFVLTSYGKETKNKININDVSPARTADITVLSGHEKAYSIRQNLSDPSNTDVKIEYPDSKRGKKGSFLLRDLSNECQLI